MSEIEIYNKQVGNRIKRLRELKGEYQKETAEAVSKMGEKLSEGQLGLYEIGARKLPPNLIKALAIHFDTTTDYLLGRTDEALLNVQKRMKENNLTGHFDIDLDKYSELDEEKKKLIAKQLNAMIDIFLEEKDK